ncbi:MAG: TonB family protein [Thermoanaerobaculia bacterium]|nr:TonB family protein [Thermoanaerobaculia bacterium]
MKNTTKTASILTVLLFAPLLAVTGPQAAASEELPPRAARLVGEGDELMASGDLDDAIRRYERAERVVDGGSIEVALALVRAYHRSGQYEKAVAKAVEARPLAETPAEQAELAYLTGRSYYESAYLADWGDQLPHQTRAWGENMEMAKTFFVNAGRTSAETVPQVFYLLGRIFETAGDRPYATEFYVDYLKRDPTGPYAALARQRLEYLQGPAPPVFAEGEITPPTVLERVVPEYTQEGSQAGINGDVVVVAVIDETGTPTVLEVVKGLPYGLSEAAVEAIEQWKFEPARNAAGEPVPVYYTLATSFRQDY